MYAYKKTMKKKVYMIAGLSLALVLTSAVALFLKVNEKDATPVLRKKIHLSSLYQTKRKYL